MSSTVIRCPAIRGFPPAIPGVVSISGCTGASVQIGTTGARRGQGYRPPTPTNAAGPPGGDYQDGTRPLISGKHRAPGKRRTLRIACCRRSADGGSGDYGAARRRRCKTRAARARANPEPGAVVVPPRRRGRTDKAVLYTGVEITKPSVAAAKDRAARMTEAAVDELRRLGVADRDMQTKAVQHPARLSVHGRVAQPDRLPGHPRTDGVAQPDAPYCMTGHGRAAESRIDRLPDQHRQRHHHRYRAWRV